MGLGLIGIGGIIGLAIMAGAYKAVFGAGWVEALVIGVLGGIIGAILFAVVVLLLSLEVLVLRRPDRFPNQALKRTMPCSSGCLSKILLGTLTSIVCEA